MFCFYFLRKGFLFKYGKSRLYLDDFEWEVTRSSSVKYSKNRAAVTSPPKWRKWITFFHTYLFFFDNPSHVRGGLKGQLESFIYYSSGWKMTRLTPVFIRGAYWRWVCVGGWVCALGGRFIDGQFSGNKGLRYLHHPGWECRRASAQLYNGEREGGETVLKRRRFCLKGEIIG